MFFLYQSIMSRKRTYRGQLIVTSIHIHVHVNIRKRVDCLRYIKKKGGGGLNENNLYFFYHIQKGRKKITR